MSLRAAAPILLAAGCIFESGPGKDDPTWPMYAPGQDDDTPGDTDGGNPTDTDTPQYASDPVTVGFTGTVATVAGTPFGLTDVGVRDTAISGSFTYDRGVPDTRWADALSSEFDHQGWDAGFVIDVGGRTVTGSGMPVVTIELFSDTFRWVDGPQLLDEGEFRVCSVDGAPDPEIELSLSVTPTDGAVPFVDDSLPADFPFIGADLAATTAITFSVEDAGGTLLMELDAFTDLDG